MKDKLKKWYLLVCGAYAFAGFVCFLLALFVSPFHEFRSGWDFNPVGEGPYELGLAVLCIPGWFVLSRKSWVAAGDYFLGGVSS